MPDKIVAGKLVSWDPNKINQPTNGSNRQTVRPNLIETLHTLSLYPGSIPNTSRLVHYFNVKDAWTPAANEFVIAAPSFTMKLGTTTFTCTPDPAFTPVAWDKDWTSGWPYQVTSTDPNITLELRAYCKPIVIKSVSDDYIQYDDEPAIVGGAEEAEAFVKWHAGQLSWDQATRDDRIQLEGPFVACKSLPNLGRPQHVRPQQAGLPHPPPGARKLTPQADIVHFGAIS